MFKIQDREIPIDKPEFLDSLDKIVCFLDFRMNNSSILDGGRIIEYSLIKCYKGGIEVFHSIARPSFSIKNNKTIEIPKFVVDKIGVPLEVIYNSPNTFEVFLRMIEFLSGVDIIVFNGYKWHIRLLKYYLIELDLDIPKIWLKDTNQYVRREYPDLLFQFNEQNGFIRCYKSLLIYELSGYKLLKEKRYSDVPYKTFWHNPNKEIVAKVSKFDKRNIKHNKWLRKGRHPLREELKQYIIRSSKDVQEAD